jgi:hypothetical protein
MRIHPSRMLAIYFRRGLVDILLAYFKNLPMSRTVLWCYLIWYLTVGFFYFDPTPRIWITSLGISGVIGIALMLSVTSPTGASRPGFWQVFRLFLMPFCVSSFSSLVKDHGFVLIFSPRWIENATALSICVGFILLTRIIRMGNSLQNDRL